MVTNQNQNTTSVDVNKVARVLNKYTDMSYEEVRQLKLSHMNRPIDIGHVKELKNELENYFELIPPITVNANTLHIIDGQHRYFAYIELYEEGKLSPEQRLDVKLVYLTEEEELVAITRSNLMSKNYSVGAFAESYATENPTYSKFIEFCLSHELLQKDGKPNYKYGLAVLLGKPTTKIIKDYALVATDEDFIAADAAHQEVLEFLNIYNVKKDTKKNIFTGNWIESLLAAWHDIRNEHSWEEWKAAFEQDARETFNGEPLSTEEIKTKTKSIKFFERVSHFYIEHKN